MIKENIENVIANINESIDKCGRNKEEVTLIAVSKTKPVSDIEEAYDFGIRDFGENKVQELVDKYDQLPKDIRWHMIGHLQTNKVKYIVDKAFLIHSVDSYHLAETISREAVKKGCSCDILIEVNVADEDTKFGLMLDEVYDLVLSISKLPSINIKGLMTVAPYVTNPENNRNVFKKLKQLSVDISMKNIHNVSMDILSMGMSGDYQVAIEEGASYIRVGTSIFGERNYMV